MFSDFQCPFCTRVEPTLTQLEKQYQGKVRTVWKNYPLPFHNNAEPAAQAAMAAQAQGKFWQMHDKLFTNQQALDRPSLEKYAQELGLDMAKFKADLDSGKYKDAVQAEMKEGQDAGRQRHAGGVHQRAQDRGRLPVRDVQEDRRPGDGEEDRAKRAAKPGGYALDAVVRGGRLVLPATADTIRSCSS